MAYGKFAPKLKINNNVGYGNSLDDIGYAIGSVLGNIWGANYNKRGIEKGEAEAREALQNAYNKAYGNAQPAPESLQTQYQDVSAKMGIPQGSQATPQSTDKTTIHITADFVEKTFPIFPFAKQTRQVSL